MAKRMPKRRNFVAMSLRSPRFAPKKVQSKKLYRRKAKHRKDGQ